MAARNGMCRASFSIFDEEHFVSATATYRGDRVFDHTKLILKYLQDH
jgi:hypothetical protein